MNRIALIFFSRSDHEEIKHKPLHGLPAFLRHRMIRMLREDAWAHVSNRGMDLVCFDESRQVGGSFGERIAHAFSEVFKMGYQAAVAVGNDCPGLATTNWEEVQASLLAGKQVVGPDMRGGAYLVGIQATDFCPEQLAAMPWQTQQLCAALLKASEDSLVLESKRDVNHLQDLIQECHSVHSGCFFVIKTLLFGLVRPISYSWTYLGMPLFRRWPVRPPPILFAWS